MAMNQREMDRYETVYSDIESSIEAAQTQIVRYKLELQEALIVRHHRQEYNTLAKVSAVTHWLLLYCGAWFVT